MRRKQRRVLEAASISGYAADGKALARAEGKVFFVEGAAPGDLADLLVVREKKDWGEARMIRLISPSPDRIEPFCGHFGLCGGCKWQMLPYEKQLIYKQAEVAAQLSRIGKVEFPPIAPILGAIDDRFYRNKLEFTFSTRSYLPFSAINDEGAEAQSAEEQTRQPALGFHAPRVFDKIIDIQTCWLLPEPSNAIRNWIREYSLSRGLSYYDIRSHQGWLRNLQLRICTTGEIMVNLILGEEQEEKRILLLDELLHAFPQISSLYYTINRKWNDSLQGLHPVLYHGNAHVREKLEDLYFLIGPLSFFQTNTRQAERLYQVTRDLARLSGNEHVFDLYCGTGSIGLFVSRQARQVTGIEIIPEAIEDARLNAANNGIENCRFYCGDAASLCNASFFEQEGLPDVIITDPPRAGMHEKLVQTLLQSGAKRIIYVSCNPATQARDLSLLDTDYLVEAVQPVDMFPHTQHIENVVALRHRNL